MPETAVIETIEVPPTPAELYTKVKAAQTPEAKAAAEAATAAAVVPPVEKRLSGDERKFRRQLSKRDQEIGALRQQIEALTPKQAAAAVATQDATQDATHAATLKRADFPSDEAFAEAKTAQTVKRELDKAAAEAAILAENKAVLAAYNERMERGPEKYPDWAETLAAASGTALNVDLGKDCPALMVAIAKSPYNDDCFYAWLKDSTKLQKLIDTYKSGPNGPVEALVAFHRFEGQVSKDAPAKKAEVKETPKAEDAAVKPPKPKPSAEAQVKGGTAAPDGKPAVFLPGTHTLNPAYQIWKRQQTSR